MTESDLFLFLLMHDSGRWLLFHRKCYLKLFWTDIKIISITDDYLFKRM